MLVSFEKVFIQINLLLCFVRVIRGGNGLADGPVKPECLNQTMKKVAQQGFAHKPQVSSCFIVTVLIFNKILLTCI